METSVEKMLQRMSRTFQAFKFIVQSCLNCSEMVNRTNWNIPTDNVFLGQLFLSYISETETVLLLHGYCYY